MRGAKVLLKASEASPGSYYLADPLGQAQLELGQAEDAKVTYRRVLEIIDRLRERNVWVAATGFTAATVPRRSEQRDVFQQAFAAGLMNFGTALMANNKADEALETFVTELVARQQGPTPPRLAVGLLNARNRIAEALNKQGKTTEALEIGPVKHSPRRAPRQEDAPRRVEL